MSELLQGHALVIGINQYGSGISQLQSAVKDAKAIAKVLGDSHAYQVRCLVDEQATCENIYDHIENIIPKVLEEDSAFLFYFAGHGVARGDGSEGPRGFLLPHDAEQGQQDSWLSMERIRKALEKCKSRHMLVILDCCFAGSFRWASTREMLMEQPLYDSQYERYLGGRAWQVLTSATHDQRAMDISPGNDNTRDGDVADGHSPFAAALLAGLAGNADSAQGKHEPDGVITATELYQYTFSELVPAEESSYQTPGIWPLRPDNQGQYIFINPKQPKKTIPDPPLDDTHNPWLGLTSYSEEHAPLFFGRENVVKRIVQQVKQEAALGLTAIVGASGTGKSSVAKAGVLVRLTNEGWNIVCSSRLSAQPMQSLDLALIELEKIDKNEKRLLFVDQFEELYTQCRSSELQTAYLDKLRELLIGDNNFYIILTVRSDFEPRLRSCPSVGDIWEENRFLVPAFNGKELREAIEGPAQVCALYFDPEEIVIKLIDEVMAMPGALPLLSFALSEMYRCAQQRRRASGTNDRALTLEDYHAIGGVVGSLHGRASALFEESSPERQLTIKRIFLRMLTQDGARLARRRIELRELEYVDAEEQERVDEVIQDYVNARLLVVNEKEIEPAHDTLVVAWEHLLNWLSESGPQTLLRAVWRSAVDWDKSNQDKGLSWHDDPRLQLMKNEALNKLEQNFVRASEKQRKNLRRRLLAISISVVMVLAFIGNIALDQLREAEYQAEEAIYARVVRDNTYLDILEYGRFFKVKDVLGEDSQGGLLNITEDWRQLVTVPQGTFVAARVYGKGRIMAVSHEKMLTYIDSDQESIFLNLALYWLIADGNSSIYFTSDHEETLPRFEPDKYEALRERLKRDDYNFDTENKSLEQALKTASVIIIANAWADLSEQELQLIDQHVLGGGGLLVAGLGWSWRDFGPHQLRHKPEAIDIYPMNKLMEHYGLTWSDEPIWVR